MKELWGRVRQRYLSVPTLVRLIPISVVLATGIVATGWTHRLLNDQRDLVVHTHEVIETTKDVLIGLDDAETGQRGYLLSGDRRYLDPYDKALERLSGMRATLARQVSDNTDQGARLARLAVLIDTKLEELQDSIALHDSEGFDSARAREIQMMERATMDRIRHEIGLLTESEKALLKMRDANVETDENRVRLVAILIAIGSFLTRAAVEMYLTRKGLDVRTEPRDGI